jgi:hypothetical protein
MSESFSVETNESASRGHPHDLLARLYREIGLSAVAAALEVTLTFDDELDASPDYAWVPREDDLAA